MRRQMEKVRGIRVQPLRMEEPTYHCPPERKPDSGIAPLAWLILLISCIVFGMGASCNPAGAVSFEGFGSWCIMTVLLMVGAHVSQRYDEAKGEVVEPASEGNLLMLATGALVVVIVYVMLA